MSMIETTPLIGHCPSSKESIEIFRLRLLSNLNSYFPDLSNDGAVISGKTIGGPYAKTFRFNISSHKNRKVVFVKICPIFEQLDPARLEFETLKLLYHRMPEVNKDCEVARPIDYFPDLNAYAMESVGSNNFKTCLLKNNSKLSNDRSLSHLLSVLSGCALWLRTFHDITRSDKRRMFDSSTFIHTIKEEFDYILLRDFKFRNDTLNRLNTVLNNLAILDGALELPCAKWHWDYTPGHIYLDNDKISVIDILGLDNTPIYEDIGHFLVAMTIVNNFPLYPLFDRKRAGIELCEHFLNAYWNDSRLDKKEFTLLSEIYALKYFILYFGGQYTRVSETIHPIAGRIFANLRSARLIEGPMVRTIGKIESLIQNFN